MSDIILDDDQKLKGHSNYWHWSFLMKAVLGAEGLRKTIIGEESDLNKVDRAYAILVMSIQTTSRIHIKSATNAKEVWDTCAEMFGDRSLQRRIHLVRTLASVKLNNYDSMDAYVSHVLELCHRLEKVDMGLSDQAIACMLLIGLPETERRTILFGIELSGSEITREKIIRKLLHSTIQPKRTIYTGRKKGAKCIQ